MSTTTVDKLHQLLAELLHCVTSLESTCGDTPAMRRIRNDVQGIRNGIHRLEIDAEELGLTSALISRTRAVDMIQISDADYDADFWRDVDHEGVGAQSLACVHVTRGRS
ncbi:MAG: hypothetical protein QOI01_1596 [Mycobacterium sp.]|jgi:hypothetical protein|nr:hypothetical protein [Mycobacterium sp.]